MANPALVAWKGKIHSCVLIACFLLSAVSRPAGAELTTPPGFNVHVVTQEDGHILWRGGAPRSDTIRALEEASSARHIKVTFIDLRHPANRDDLAGWGGRLSPAAEKRMAEGLGLHYISISALDKHLLASIHEALKAGDVYIHCMYGVNRTGFAIGRLATADRLIIDRTGLGKRDWREGDAFQARIR